MSMKKNHTLLILGGDFRQLEVIRLLAPKLQRIYLVGFENATIESENTIKIAMEDVPLSIIDSILLPIPGIQEDGVVESNFTEKEVILTKEVMKQTREDCTLYSGIITPFLHDLSKRTNRKIVALFARNDVAILNSIPTAEGVLMLAIQHTDITVHQSQVTVLGFGRVGKTVARLFSAVGANVSVFARKAEDIARIIEMGLMPISHSDFEKTINNQDIIINTVPSLIITSSLIREMSSHALIIDLASKPGGTDFDSAKRNHIQTIWALGLPAKVAPKTSGSIIATTLLDYLITK